MNRFLAYIYIKFARELQLRKREEIYLAGQYEEGTLSPKEIVRFFTLKATNIVVSYFSPSFLVHWFFWVLLVAMLVFIKISAKDTQEILKKREQMPIIELEDYQIYDADKDYIKSSLQGQRALRFAEYEVGYETIVSNKSDKKAQSISYIYGEEVRRVDNEYAFNKGGVYAKDSGESFWSERGIYDMKNGIFRGVGRFWAVSLSGDLEGENILYKQKEGTMSAQNVQAKIYLDTNNKKAKE